MATIGEKLRASEAILRASGIIDPGREASLLVGCALKRDRTFLIAHPEYDLTESDAHTIDAFVRRRAAHEPYQYISGVQEFYGLEFDVTPDVLIPRPETELVVEQAIEILRAADGSSICDVGTGSGCIPISILHRLDHVRGIGLEISSGALKVAEQNANKHGVSDRLDLLESDLFSVLHEERFDVVVSNPPYVPVEDIDGLQVEVRDFEPHLALTDNSDGLSIIRRIVEGSPRHLVAGGHLLMEIGFAQSEKVVGMFDRTRWQPPILHPDLQGIPRVVSAKLI